MKYLCGLCIVAIFLVISPVCGFANQAYVPMESIISENDSWLTIDIPDDLIDQNVVLHIPNVRIHNYELFSQGPDEQPGIIRPIDCENSPVRN